MLPRLVIGGCTPRPRKDRPDSSRISSGKVSVTPTIRVLAMLGSAAIGVVHVGVEGKLWPSPLPGCVARFTPGAGIADLPARPAKPCDDPTYLISGLPVSMAAMNLIFSLGSVAAMAAVMVRNRSRQR